MRWCRNGEQTNVWRKERNRTKQEKFREWKRKVYLKPPHSQASKPVTAERVRRAFLNPALFSPVTLSFSPTHNFLNYYAYEIIGEVKNFHTPSQWIPTDLVWEGKKMVGKWERSNLHNKKNSSIYICICMYKETKLIQIMYVYFLCVFCSMYLGSWSQDTQRGE